MADQQLRDLERRLIQGDITQEQLDVATCRHEGHQMVEFETVVSSRLPGWIQMLICRTCLMLQPVWDKPQDLPRCEMCRSPVLMRKAGVCLDCGTKLTMPKDTPPIGSEGQVMTGMPATSTMRHAAMRLPNRGSRTRVKSLCGSNLVDDSLEIGDPECLVCITRLRTARRRAKVKERRDNPPVRNR